MLCRRPGNCNKTSQGLVEDHKQSLLKSIEELYQLTERQSEVRGLQQELGRAQARLEAIRKENPDVLMITGEAETQNLDDIKF